MEIIQHLILVVISHMVAYLSRWHQKQCKDLHVFDNLESGNCFRKAWKESGILGPKVCTNPVFTVVQSSIHHHHHHHHHHPCLLIYFGSFFI